MTDAERGKVDHMFLACDILGMDFQETPHASLFKCFLPKDPSKQLNDLDTQIKKRMILWPRGTFKTSSVVIEITQLILNYPNIRILILSGKNKLAQSQLGRVKRFFEAPTEKFQRLYGEYCGKKLGNMSEFTIPNRTRTFLAEPTLSISSARSTKAGTHYDVIFVDDLVNDQNYQHPDALEKCWEDYKAIGPVLEPAGFLFVTGTRYSFGDTYERIQEAARNEMKETGKTVWEFSIKTCWATDSNGKRICLFPQTRTKDGRTIGHTIEFLESERREKGDEFFSNQYENSPLASGTQTFTDDLLDKHTLYHFEKPTMESELAILSKQVQAIMQTGKTFEEAVKQATEKKPTGEIPLGGWCFVMGDLSYVGDERNGAKRDKSVFLVVRVVNGRLYVIACHSGKWKSSEVGDQIVFLLLQYRPRIIWCEAFLGYEAYDTVIRLTAAARGIQNLPLEWIPLTNQAEAKVVRIGSCQAWFQRDKLYLFAGMNDFQILRANLTKWPRLGRHDDHGDCLGLAVNAPHGVALYQPIKEAATTSEYIKQVMVTHRNREDHENSYAENGCGSTIVSG